MRDKILSQGKYSLASLEKADLNLIRVWRNQQMWHLRQFRPLVQQNQEEYWLKISQDPALSLFAILNNESEELRGYGGLTNIHSVYSHAELSFLVNPRIYQESSEYREIFMAFLKMICKFAFNHMNLNRVFTETYDNKVKHQEILEEFGFTREGSLREHVFKGGHYLNSAIHGLLRKEYSRGNDDRVL